MVSNALGTGDSMTNPAERQLLNASNANSRPYIVSPSCIQ
jgi:hypothetical protein